jgi:hypothetical protein
VRLKRGDITFVNSIILSSVGLYVKYKQHIMIYSFALGVGGGGVKMGGGLLYLTNNRCRRSPLTRMLVLVRRAALQLRSPLCSQPLLPLLRVVVARYSLRGRLLANSMDSRGSYCHVYYPCMTVYTSLIAYQLLVLDHWRCPTVAVVDRWRKLF